MDKQRVNLSSKQKAMRLKEWLCQLVILTQVSQTMFHAGDIGFLFSVD